jgi:putative IMPACT (imprinted ancient) family translation regulator
MSNYLNKEDSKKETQKHIDKKRTLHEDYLTKVENLGGGGSFKGTLTQFFNLTNAYRNAANKELNQMEAILHKNIRQSALYKNNSDLRQSLNADYAKFNKDFSDQDQLLRKRMSEILNAAAPPTKK